MSTKYQIRVKGSPMEIVGVPMWPGEYSSTRAEAEEALKKAKREIVNTWASPMLNDKGETMIPVWIEAVNVKDR